MKGIFQETHSQENKNVFGTTACYKQKNLPKGKAANICWKWQFWFF